MQIVSPQPNISKSMANKTETIKYNRTTRSIKDQPFIDLSNSKLTSKKLQENEDSSRSVPLEKCTLEMDSINLIRKKINKMKDLNRKATNSSGCSNSVNRISVQRENITNRIRHRKTFHRLNVTSSTNLNPSSIKNRTEITKLSKNKMDSKDVSPRNSLNHQNILNSEQKLMKLESIENTTTKNMLNRFKQINRSNYIIVNESKQPLEQIVQKLSRLKRNVDLSQMITSNDTSYENIDTDCVHPEYLVFTWVLCLVALATTLKLYFLIKTMLAVAMVTAYSILLIYIYPNVFQPESGDV